MTGAQRIVLRKLHTAGRLKVTERDPRVVSIHRDQVALYDVDQLVDTGHVTTRTDPAGQLWAELTDRGQAYLTGLEVAH